MTTPTVESLAALGRRLWITTLLWVVGRTLCRAARIDDAVAVNWPPCRMAWPFALRWGGLITP